MQRPGRFDAWKRSSRLRLVVLNDAYSYAAEGIEQCFNVFRCGYVEGNSWLSEGHKSLWRLNAMTFRVIFVPWHIWLRNRPLPKGMACAELGTN
jgi:hypothetical protein